MLEQRPDLRAGEDRDVRLRKLLQHEVEGTSGPATLCNHHELEHDPRDTRPASGERREHLVRPHHAFGCTRLGERTDPAHDHAAEVTRSPSNAAHTAAWGPPPERPITAKRSIPRWSASCATSCGQSTSRRPVWNVLSPYPGRSGQTSRSPAVGVDVSSTASCSRDPGVPWNAKHGPAGRIPDLEPAEIPAVGQDRDARVPHARSLGACHGILPNCDARILASRDSST